MDEITQIIATGLKADIAQLNQISSNVANVNTPGYLGHTGYLVTDKGGVDFRSQLNLGGGDLRRTEAPFDLGITGNGAFLVELDGQLYLTRNGRFHRDAAGYIRHQSGGYLLSDSGRLQTAGESFKVDGQGYLVQGGQRLERLALQGLGQADASNKGYGLLTYGGVTPLNEESLVMQGYLNASNVDTSHEMSRVIEVNRHVQSLQKVAIAYDQLLGKGINEFGNK